MRVLIFGKGGALAGQLEAAFAPSSLRAETGTGLCLSERSNPRHEGDCHGPPTGVGGPRNDGKDNPEVISLSHADCDITDATAVGAAIAKYKPTHILNAAAYNAVDEVEVDNAAAIAVNSTAVGHIARAAAAHRGVMVHYSTDYVFEGKKQEGYRESDEPNPVNAYGQSKRGGEIEIEALAAMDSAFRWYIIRTSRLFGALGGGASAKKSFVDLLFERARTGSTIEVIDAEVSSPTYTADLAAATARLLKSSVASGIFHLTNSGTCTRYQCAREVFTLWHDLSGEPLPTIVPVHSFPNRKARRPAYSGLLNTKLPLLRPWQEALRDYLSTRVEV